MEFPRQMQLGAFRPSRRLVRSLVLAALLVLATLLSRWLPQPMPETVEGRPRLVDGDSFFLGADEVRLVGIDAPAQPSRLLTAHDGGPGHDKDRHDQCRP